MMTPSSTASRSPSIFHWILIVGGIGFSAGFFGPMILVPEANQGPMVGIFLSGPGSTVLGIILFVISRIFRVSAKHQWNVLWISSAVVALVTLFFCLPQPAYKGYILDAQIQSCSTPGEGSDEAIAYWEKRIAAVTWASPRADWQADTRRILQGDSAAVLKLTDINMNKVYENRKPWNHGSKLSRGWRTLSERSYYVSGSCKEYAAGSRMRRFVVYDADDRIAAVQKTTDWPPRDPSGLLNLEVLEPIPPEYQQFAVK